MLVPVSPGLRVNLRVFAENGDIDLFCFCFNVGQRRQGRIYKTIKEEDIPDNSHKSDVAPRAQVFLFPATIKDWNDPPDGSVTASTPDTFVSRVL